MKHLVEIGGGTILHSWQYYEPGDKLRVFEPNPKNITVLQKDYPKAEILPFAIWKEKTTLQLHDFGDISFIKDLISPAIQNNGYQGENFITIQAYTFDQFDDGTITHLWIDNEGAEWYVLPNLKSRPSFISVEMAHINYKNPFYEQIKQWMVDNFYTPAGQDAGSYFYELRK